MAHDASARKQVVEEHHMNALSADTFDNVEVQHLCGDVVWYYGDHLILLLTLEGSRPFYFNLRFFNLNEGRTVVREHGMHWILGRVKV